MNGSARIETLRERLASEEIPALVVSNPVNVAYVTGFDGVFDGEDAHAAVITADRLVLYTDSRYVSACQRSAADGDWRVISPPENLYATLCGDLQATGVDALALEESVPHGRFRFMSSRFEGKITAVDQWVEEVRQVKEPDEIARITAAQELTDRAFAHILGTLSPGVTERAVALELEHFMRSQGSDGVAFSSIVASGERSACPHARASERVLQRGDLVTMDFGARVDGYCADMTRTVVLGPATDRQREVYAAVLQANMAGIAAVRPGRSGSDIDAAARAVLEQAGLGSAFGHGLGHGVGMAVHELPSVNSRAAKTVREHAVITIEPGAYVPGFGGVRIEDLLVVESSGARVLTCSGKELLEL